jgi:hypothetical protein
MSDESLAMEENPAIEGAQEEADYAAQLAESRAAATAAERAQRQKTLREKGRLPEQNHVAGWKFAVMLFPAALNDILDFIEIPADLTLIAAIPIKAVMMGMDICTALVIMVWAATELGTGFFGTRRIAMLIGTVIAEFIPIIGIAPCWTLFVLIEWFMQSSREKSVKMLAKKNPEKAEKAAVRLQAAQRVAERRASKLGKQAEKMTASAPSLRGASAAERKQALNIRRQAGKKLAPDVKEQILTPLGREFERTTGSSEHVRRGAEDNIAKGTSSAFDKVSKKNFDIGSDVSRVAGALRGKHQDAYAATDFKDRMWKIKENKLTPPKDKEIEKETKKLAQKYDEKRQRNLDSQIYED